MSLGQNIRVEMPGPYTLNPPLTVKLTGNLTELQPLNEKLFSSTVTETAGKFELRICNLNLPFNLIFT